jgi:pimeloyl-ACP methyl ester carboxylesterase
VVVIPGAGHAAHLERPDLVAEAIADAPGRISLA